MSSPPSQSSQQVRVKPIACTRRSLKEFYQVPFALYKETPQWVAPFYGEFREFFSKKNRLWDHAECCLFLAYKDGIVVGRIAAIIDHLYVKLVSTKIGFFGFFECIDDFACAQALFEAAEQWLSSKDAVMMRGPVDGRIDIGCGFLIQGFDAPQSLLATYSPPYYARLAEQYGLQKTKDLLTYKMDLTQPLPAKLLEKAQQCRDAGVYLRPFNRLRAGKELGWWVDLFLETFQGHWGFVPVSAEEVRRRFGIRQIRWFVDARLFQVAESQGRPVAYLWATPDYNEVFRALHGRLGLRGLVLFELRKGKITTGKLQLIGIRNDFRDKAVASCLNHAVFVEMQRRGYRYAEIGWIDEENRAARNTMAVTGASVFKVHRVYEKSLQEVP